MKLRITISLLVFCSHFLVAQDVDIFKIYKGTGEQVDYQELITSISSYDVVLFGEMHNCPVTHWLEKQIAKSLYAVHKRNFVMGAEMFERDNQLIFQEYLTGMISEERFDDEMRLWPNYTTDYMPLVDFAKENQIPFVATNIPRRYARVVSEKGLAEFEKLLGQEARAYIAPLPISYEADATKNSFFKMMSSMGHSKKNPEFIAQAQAIKDATMAWFITQYAKEKHFLHFNGSYHSDSASGIPFYIRAYAPSLKFVRISSARQETLSFLQEENKGRADYIIVVRDDFSYSY